MWDLPMIFSIVEITIMLLVVYLICGAGAEEFILRSDQSLKAKKN